MVLTKYKKRVDNIPVRLVRLGRYFTQTRGNLRICSYGIERRRTKRLVEKGDTKELQRLEALCFNPAQAKCNNCGLPYCSIHLDKHKIFCWGL